VRRVRPLVHQVHSTYPPPSALALR
jgi:hypothetical protein